MIEKEIRKVLMKLHVRLCNLLQTFTNVLIAMIVFL